MDTLSRLRELIRAGRRADSAPVRELTYEPVGEDGQPLDATTDVEALEGATFLETPFGPIAAVDRVVEADAAYGRHRVEDFALVDPGALAALCARPLDVDACTPRAPVFLDLETTGLAGGAGTVAFLVGCGYFDQGAFRTRQFFLHGFAHERALLHAVAAFLSDVPFIVTYNGRTFDAPVMETRWMFHRLPSALDGLPHVDMLPPARRLWRERVDSAETSCRLIALEDALFGVRRVGDVPGAEIPQRYFAFVRSGDVAPLEPVLMHNRLDLLSLAAVMARAQRLVRLGAEYAADAREAAALGGIHERQGDVARAEQAYRVAVAHPVTDRESREVALVRLATLLRRERRHGEAAPLWQQVVAQGYGRSQAAREAIRALAIHHEHRARDLAAARAFALRALQSEPNPRLREDIRYRLARLERKLAREREARGGVDAPLLSGTEN